MTWDTLQMSIRASALVSHMWIALKIHPRNHPKSIGWSSFPYCPLCKVAVGSICCVTSPFSEALSGCFQSVFATSRSKIWCQPWNRMARCSSFVLRWAAESWGLVDVDFFGAVETSKIWRSSRSGGFWADSWMLHGNLKHQCLPTVH